MKRILFLLVIGALVYVWVKHPELAREYTARGLAFVSEKLGVWAGRLEPELETASPGQSKGVESTLPPRVYVLRANVIAKAQPVPGTIAKGTQVRVIGEGAGKKIITDEVHEAIVDEQLLTRDAAEAEALAKMARQEVQGKSDQRRAVLQQQLGAVETKLNSLKREVDEIRKKMQEAKERGVGYSGTPLQFVENEIRRQEGFKMSLTNQLQSTQPNPAPTPE